MKRSLESHVLSPCCYRPVSLTVEQEVGDIVLEGEFNCLGCGSKFPVFSGIPLLSVIDRSWEPMLREFIARLYIDAKVTSGTGIEKDRQERDEEYRPATARSMDRLFNEAVKNLEIKEGTRVLDLGAGNCETSGRFADLGADVVASDVDWSQLQVAGFLLGDSKVTFPVPDLPFVYHKYFSRLMGDIHRIPFKEATFDITCCRATMHHLDDIPGALREMARVTKPGGTILLLGEPLRSVLDSQIKYLEGIFDYEEGLNEQCLPLTSYLFPLRKYTDRTTVKCIELFQKHRTARLMSFLKLDNQKLFKDSEEYEYPRALKLLFTGAVVNIAGIRSSKPARRPKQIDKDDIVVDVGKMVFDQAWRLDRMKSVHQAMLDVSSLPSSVSISDADIKISRGFREPEKLGDHTFRYSFKRASYFLKNKKKAHMIGLRIFGFPPVAGIAKGTVCINSCVAGIFEAPTQDFFDVFVEKPSIYDDILEVEIINDLTIVPGEVMQSDDIRELGVGVEKIWQTSTVKKPESNPLEKLRYYYESEGLLPVMKRSFKYLRAKAGLVT